MELRVDRHRPSPLGAERREEVVDEEELVKQERTWTQVRRVHQAAPHGLQGPEGREAAQRQAGPVDGANTQQAAHKGPHVECGKGWRRLLLEARARRPPHHHAAHQEHRVRGDKREDEEAEGAASALEDDGQEVVVGVVSRRLPHEDHLGQHQVGVAQDDPEGGRDA